MKCSGPSGIFPTWVENGSYHKTYHLRIYVVVWTLALAPDPGTVSTSLKEQLCIGIGKRKFGGTLWKKLTIFLDVLILPMNHPFEHLHKITFGNFLDSHWKNLNNTIYINLCTFFFLLSLYHHQKQCRFHHLIHFL